MNSLQLAGITLPSLGFGAAQLGNLNRETTTEHSVAAVDAAWELGVRYFDTAPHYGVGLSERRLGIALANRPRDEFLISSKVGRLLVPTPERAQAGELDGHGFQTPATHRRVWDFSRDGIMRSVDGSLERLGLDHLDIALLHDPDDHWEEASTTGIAALLELRDQGVVRAVGVGMNQADMLIRFVEESGVDVVMEAGRYTLLDQSAAGLLSTASQHGVGVIAAGVYNSGLLSQAQVSPAGLYDYARAPERMLRRARRMAAACESYGVTLPDAAVQFPLQNPAVDSVVVGVRTVAHIRSALERVSVPIPADLWSELAAIR